MHRSSGLRVPVRDRRSGAPFAWMAAGLAAGCSANSGTNGIDAGGRASSDASLASSSTSGGSSGSSSSGAPMGSSSASGGGPVTGSSGSSGGGGLENPEGGGDVDSGKAGSPDSSIGGDAANSSDGGGASPSDSGSDSGGSVHAGLWRIMPLGDSITGSMCPPQLLSQQLKANGRNNFAFYGSNLNNQNCNGAPNVMTEGHGGYLVTDLVGTGQHAAELPQWCSADKADVVLMLFGTNDAWNSRSTQSILDAYSVVLSDLRAVNPNVILFVGQITPLNPAGCANCETNVENLNAQIPSWASSKSTSISPIYVVDVHSAFTAATYTPNSIYTSDGVHPNPAGSKLVADKWYSALIARGLP